MRRSTVPSPLGDLDVWTSDQGVAAVLFDGHRRPNLDRILARLDDAEAVAPDALDHGVAAALGRYFAGELGALDGLPLDLRGTALQVQVWEALRAIPARTFRAYGELAVELGLGVAGARAVGAAVGRNPVSIAVPCHRLVGATGALTGYAGGLRRKRWLLDHEAGQPALW